MKVAEKVECTGLRVDPRFNECHVEGCVHGATTVVWRDRVQFNICAPCLKQKLESGEWICKAD